MMVYACRGSRPLRMTGDMFFGTIKNGRGRAPTLQNSKKIFDNLFDFVGATLCGRPFFYNKRLQITENGGLQSFFYSPYL